MKSMGQHLAAAAVLALAPAIAIAENTDDWHVTAGVYAYLPSITGTSNFSVPPSNSGSTASVDIDQILSNLKFVFMGAVDARKGSWGAYADLIYMDIGDTKTGSRSLLLAGGRLPAGASGDLDYSLSGSVMTFGAYYRGVSSPGFVADFIVGARVLDLEQSLGWSLQGDVAGIPVLDRAGQRENGLTNWDAIVGIKGRYTFGESGKWFAPYYLDVGAGNSGLTWQGMAGVGYAFGWGDLFASWRHIEYDMEEGEVLDSLAFSGPAFAAVFHW